MVTSRKHKPEIEYWNVPLLVSSVFCNLDIFRAFYEPFCIHPHMTVVQALALDYLIAIYPLMLILLALALVSLHDRQRNVVLVALWRPFEKTLTPFVHNLNIKTSLIESFATLYFLSAMKVQSVSLDLLIPIRLYYTNSTMSDKRYLYLAGDVEFFGEQHWPYALLALFFLTLFTLLPGMLFFLYPYSFFRKFLSRIHCDSIALKTFMDVFQGNYKDRTNNTRDYRFFSGVFFITRFVILVNFISLSSFFSLMVLGFIVVMLGFSIAILHPQTTKHHYILDCTTFILLSIIAFATIGYMLSPANYLDWNLSSDFGGFAVLLPLLYLIIVGCYWSVAKKRIPQRLVMKVLSRCSSRRSESQRLLDY